jgi:hypothetical protein
MPESIYGRDMLEFVTDFRALSHSAYETAFYLLTQGSRYSEAEALGTLGFFDRAAYQAFKRHRDLFVAENPSGECLTVYVNSLGRLHIRKLRDQRATYDIPDNIVDVGYVEITADILAKISDRVAAAMDLEDAAYAKTKRALDQVDAGAVLKEVIDHVQHVESVCFYAGDRLLARVDKFSNLIDPPKGSGGFLNSLCGKPYPDWSRDEILVVAALHALFLSGKAVRFEEFNGLVLTATALWEKLHALLRAYREAGCCYELAEDADLFELARMVRQQSLKSHGSNWLRYRCIYGLNFQKNERVLISPQSNEHPLAYMREFGEQFQDLVSEPPGEMNEGEFFFELAQAALDRDAQGLPYVESGSAADSRLEQLIEDIVVSAIHATESDYGMSSSLRDVSNLLDPDDAGLMKRVHELSPGDFFTCFVSARFGSTIEKDVADAIALSVQRRMMFNRWHFIPGNFERSKIITSRHWYYPPVIPDIAVHSDVHRGAHAKAQVKYSIRAPGPDMSRPPLMIAGRPYRGFYDVRVVRMTKPEFTTEDMLRVRRRTLWMESVYAALVDYLQMGQRLKVTGFAPGRYLDIESRAQARTERQSEGKQLAAST